MPFIIAKTNVAVSREQERALKEGLGAAIAFVPGKCEENLMVELQDKRHLYLAGSDAPAALVEVHVFGNIGHAGYERLTAAVAELYHAVLGIDEGRIFVRYGDIEAWGVGGAYVDVRAFA